MTLEIASEPKQQILISARIESLESPYLHSCTTLVWAPGLGHPKRESCAHMGEMYFFLKEPSDFFNN